MQEGVLAAVLPNQTVQFHPNTSRTSQQQKLNISTNTGFEKQKKILILNTNILATVSHNTVDVVSLKVLLTFYINQPLL